MVILGPYEHHSNILPWKESGATVLTVDQTSKGQINLEDLEEKLQVFTKGVDKFQQKSDIHIHSYM